MNINKKLSVITVTYNNRRGLEETLRSLANCRTRPHVIHIQDGGSTDDSIKVVDNYRKKLNIEWTSEKDLGIYDAMNKAQRKLISPLVHYLNAGDTVYGDPYISVDEPALLPTLICDNDSSIRWFDKVKLYGYGYCHQGIIFPATHQAYDLKYGIAADFKVICNTFSAGLKFLPVMESGGVCYQLGGLSSIAWAEANRQITSIAREELTLFQWALIDLSLTVKSLIPRGVRRNLAKWIIR